MKKLILFAIPALLLSSFANAQLVPEKVPCEDCRTFPFKPNGCDHSTCMAQMLSTITRDQLINTFLLPGNVADKIINARNINGRMSLAEYRAALEPEEYKRLTHAYDMYVQQYTPHIPKTEQQVKDFAPPIYFDVNKTTIREPYQKVLRQAVIALKDDIHLKVTIIGSADNTGSESANRSISLTRANVVKKYLVAHGIAAGRITIVGHHQPAGDNSDGAAFRSVTMETSR